MLLFKACMPYVLCVLCAVGTSALKLCALCAVAPIVLICLHAPELCGAV